MSGTLEKKMLGDVLGANHSTGTDKKRCSQCKKIKSIDDFGIDRSGHSKDGKAYRCKECKRANTKKYYSNNLGKHTEIASRFYKNNKEKISNKYKIWWAKNSKRFKKPKGYSTCHREVREIRGTPSKCELCGTESNKVKYDWANISGNYKDIYDYKRMCHPCHLKFDYGRKKEQLTEVGGVRLVN
jgi:hypothetical protein